VIEAEQTEEGTTERNDRLLGRGRELEESVATANLLTVTSSVGLLAGHCLIAPDLCVPSSAAARQEVANDI
jgi:hypothetical protein